MEHKFHCHTETVYSIPLYAVNIESKSTIGSPLSLSLSLSLFPKKVITCKTKTDSGGSVGPLKTPFWQEIFHFHGDFGEILEISRNVA